MADIDQWAQSAVGKVIGGKYEVVRTLGVGGFGGVFLCRHKMLDDRPFALKLIIPNPHAGSLHDQEQRFAREAATALTFVHPRVVQVREFGADHENDVLYMAMDYAEGTSLAKAIGDSPALKTQGATPIEPERALRITLMVLDVLEAAHAADVVHRDLKPGNIMLVDDDGREDIRLLDFGLAKMISASAGDQEAGAEGESKPRVDSRLLAGGLTQAGTVLGTPQYMAPEQARGRRADHRADLYSLGVVLYEMLTGTLPHRGSSIHELLFERATEPPIPIEEARPDVEFSAPLRVVLDYALDPEPENRFKDASAFARAVAEALDQLGAERPKRDTQAMRILDRRDTAVTTSLPGLQAVSAKGKRRSGPLVLGAIGAAIALTLALAYAGLAIQKRARCSKHLRDGDAALAEGRTGAALGSYLEAGRIRPEAREARAAVRRALDMIEQRAVASGNVSRLSRDIAGARQLGCPLDDIEGLEDTLALGLKLEGIDELLEQLQYTRAKDSLDSVKAVLPATWAARVRRQKGVAEGALASAKQILDEAAQLAQEGDLGELERSAALLTEFLERFPHHPAHDKVRVELARVLSIKKRIADGTPAGQPTRDKRTGLKVRSRPQGLRCSLDGRHVGTTPVELLEGIEPGAYTVELADSEGFVSRHPVVVKEGAVALLELDHTAAVAAERRTYLMVAAAWPGPTEQAINVSKQYLDDFPDGSKRNEVSAILLAAQREPARRKAEREGFLELRALRGQPGNTEDMLEAATEFLVRHPDSEHAQDVGNWQKAWRRAHLHQKAERESRENVLALLSREDAGPEERAEAVRDYVDRFGEGESASGVHAVLEAFLLRPLEERNVLLAAPAGRGRAALIAVDQPAVSIYALASGRKLATASLVGHDAVSLASDPDGHAVFVGTKAGCILRWQPLPKSVEGAGPPAAPTEVFRLGGPVHVLVALSGNRTVAADGTTKGSCLLTRHESGRFAATRPRAIRGGLVCGARSADGRRIVLGDRSGTLAVLSIAEDGGISTLWKTRIRGQTTAAALSADGRIVAASVGSDRRARTILWVQAGKRWSIKAEHSVSGRSIQILDHNGRLLVGNVVVGPDPDRRGTPLGIGAAWPVDPFGRYLIATSAEGNAVVCNLAEVLRNVDLRLRKRGPR